MNKLTICLLSIFLIGVLYSEEGDSKSLISKWNSNHHYQNPFAATNNSSAPNEVSFARTNNPYIGYCDIDFLWWKAKRTSFAYRFLREGEIASRPVGTIIDAKSKFSPGFRVGLGFSNVYDWMISGEVTFYQNKVLDHLKDGSTIFRTLSTIVDFNSLFKLTYWTADFMFSNHFALNKTVSIRPFIALRGAQFKNYIMLDFSDTVPNDSTIYHTTYRFPYNFLGFGPNIGMKGFYEFNNTGVTLFGSVASSLLYGKVKVANFSRLPVGGTFRSIVVMRSRFDDLKASLQLQLGAFWKYYFDSKTKVFKVGMNYEGNYWWNLKDYYTRTTPITQATQSIIMSGFNVSIGFEF